MGRCRRKKEARVLAMADAVPMVVKNAAAAAGPVNTCPAGACGAVIAAGAGCVGGPTGDCSAGYY